MARPRSAIRLPLLPILPILLPVLLASLAGCASPGPEASEEDAAVPAPAAAVQVHALHGESAAVARSGHVPERPVLAFDTPAGVRAIVVELTWDDGVQDLDSFLQAAVPHCPAGSSPVGQAFEAAACAVEDAYFGYPGFGAFRNSDGEPGEPDDPSRMFIVGRDLAAVLAACGDPCRWEAWPEAREPAAAVRWSLYVSVFTGDLPMDYTAIPA